VENLAPWKRALAEFSAVFLLASIGLMTVATALTTGAYGLFELSIAFGFAITVMVVVAAAVSGGHFNPAITIMLASFRRFAWRDVPVYIAAQISGGVLGALVLYFFFSGPIRAFEAASNITRGQPGSSLSGMIFACYSPNPAIAAAQKWPLSIISTPTAVLATFILAIVIFTAVDTRNSFAPNLPIFASGSASSSPSSWWRPRSPWRASTRHVTSDHASPSRCSAGEPPRSRAWEGHGGCGRWAPFSVPWRVVPPGPSSSAGS
jgi:glycerol uptake facilitator protein